MPTKTNRIKIALEGAACVGKTSLLEALKTKYSERSKIAFLDEAARTYFMTHQVEANDVFSVPVQTALQNIIWQKERATEKFMPEVIFCDRSVIDSPVHVLANGYAAEAAVLLENVHEWLSTYHLFLLLDPRDVPYETDEIRRESLETRQIIHETFLKFFTEHHLPYRLLSGSLAERVKTVEELIKQFF